jgi:hypothetical protein
MLRLLGWLVVAVLLAAAAYELALALGAGTIGPEPGDGVTGEKLVSTLGYVAIAGGIYVAGRYAQHPRLAVALLAPVAAAFVVARFLTFDPYYAPSLRRYSDGSVSPAWVAVVAVLAAGAGALAWARPRPGALATIVALGLLLLTGVLMGGH